MCENAEEFRMVYTILYGSPTLGITRTKLFKVISCAGKNISDINEHWPQGEEMIDFESAWHIYRKSTSIDNCDDVVREGVTVPYALVLAKMQEIIPSDEEKRYLENFLVRFDVDGMFGLEKFNEVTTRRRVETLQRMLADEDEETIAESPSRPNSTVSIGEETEKYPFVVKCRGFILIGHEIRSIEYRFTNLHEQKVEIGLKVITNTDMDADAFQNDLFIIIFDVNTGDSRAVSYTKRKDSITTGPVSLPPGEYTVSVFCIGVTVKPQEMTGARGLEPLLDEKRKLTKRFKMTLMNIFEMFDIDMDGVLNHKEFNTFNEITGEDTISDEDWVVLKENFELRDEGVPLSSFLGMHQLEVESCEADYDGDIMDMWASLHLIGYNDRLRLNWACPFEIFIASRYDMRITEELRMSTKEEREHITAFFFLHGEPLEADGLSVRFFRTDYFGAIVADEKPTATDDEIYEIDLRVAPTTVKVKATVDYQKFQPSKYKSKVNLFFLTSPTYQWDLTVKFTRKTPS